MPIAPSTLARLAVVGLAVVLVGHLGLLLVGGVAGVRSPTSIEYGEPYIVSAAYHAATGGDLYAPVDELPLLHNNYNPLVQLAVGPWLVDGVSYTPGRLVTLSSVLLVLGLAGALVWRTTRSVVAGVVGALLPLTCGFMFPWMCVGRVDAFATLCSCAAFCWAATHQEGPWRSRAWMLLPAWIAFAAKQSVVGGCGAALLLAFIRGRRSEAIGLGVLFTVGCAGIAGLANVLSEGQYWLHAVAYNASHDRGGLWPETLPPLRLLEAIGWPLLILLGICLPKVRKADAPWVCWLAVTFVLGFMLVRKSGAHVHYFLEAVVAMSVLTASVGARALQAAPPRGLRPALAIFALLVATIPGVPWEGPKEWRSGAYFKFGQARSLIRIAAAEDPIPAEVRRRIETASMSPLLLAKTATIAIECGRPAIFDVADFARLQALGEWDPERLLRHVRAARFPVVAVQPFDDPDIARLFGVEAIVGLREALELHYQPLPQPYRDRSGRVTATFWVPKS